MSNCEHTTSLICWMCETTSEQEVIPVPYTGRGKHALLVGEDTGVTEIQEIYYHDREDYLHALRIDAELNWSS